MAEDYRIHLNFLPVVGEIPDFQVHRKLRAGPQEDRPEGQDIACYRLPAKEGDQDDWPSFWVAFTPEPGFEPAVVKAAQNLDLTAWALFRTLGQQCADKLTKTEYWLPERGFLREIHFNMQHHEEGDEQLIVRPYHLRAARKFGVFVDFHFRLGEGVKFSRRVQQLSLSLDRNFRRNLDCYVDRFAKIVEFVERRWDVLSPINLPTAKSGVILSKECFPLPAYQLRSKVYVFGGDHDSKSQFLGLKDHGPLKPLDGPPKLLFMFRERDRQAARTLAATLRGGQRARYSFPGFEQIFKTPIEIDSNPVVVTDFSPASMEAALARVRKETPLTVPVLIMPDNDQEGYLNHKALFTHAGIPSQVCTLGVIQDENTLKWSAANIALQIFCKAGGLPWKVRPAGESCLVIGISQSHKVRKEEGKTTVERYFAFSILTDSSGLFQKIQVLGQAADEDSYLKQVRENLEKVLATGAQQFSHVVVHTSFKLKHSEMDAIQKVVQDAAKGKENAQCRFAVVKVNNKSHFFGANRSVNSLVPYEGTRVKLGHGEYLVWFEGIFPDKPTVTKAFPGPTHLYFLRVTEENKINDELLLQDLVNLSGANWRGFNAKSAPVSVFYCHLVADMVHDFQERGLPLPAVEELKPWFL